MSPASLAVHSSVLALAASNHWLCLNSVYPAVDFSSVLLPSWAQLPSYHDGVPPRLQTVLRPPDAWKCISQPHVLLLSICQNGSRTTVIQLGEGHKEKTDQKLTVQPISHIVLSDPLPMGASTGHVPPSPGQHRLRIPNPPCATPSDPRFCYRPQSGSPITLTTTSHPGPPSLMAFHQ